MRAATTGEWGRRSSGAPSGSSIAGNATSPPLSRTMSCAAAASTARQRQSVAMPSTRVAATWHSDTAIVPIARIRPVTSLSASEEAASHFGSADSIATSSRRPSGRRRSGGAVGQRHVVEERAQRRGAARHSSPGPKS